MIVLLLFKVLISFLLDKYPEVGLLDHMVVLFLIFWEIAILFSIVAAPMCISWNIFVKRNFLSTTWLVVYLERPDECLIFFTFIYQFSKLIGFLVSFNDGQLVLSFWMHGFKQIWCFSLLQFLPLMMLILSLIWRASSFVSWSLCSFDTT